MASGMGATPGLARRLTHNRLFGAAIVAAGASLILVALAPHLFVALGAVALVGCCAGVAFLTGLTIIGAQVANEIRGRVVAFVQSLVRIDLLASMAVVPLATGLVQTRVISIDGHPYHIDGTRTVLSVAGLIAAIVGVLAYRQMDDRDDEPLLPDLLGALRRTERRTGGGMLVAVEGATATESAEQTARLVAWLRSEGHVVTQPGEGRDDSPRLTHVLIGGDLVGTRARALAAAAVRADVVEREVRPALEAGDVVVMDRFLASPLAQFGMAGAGLSGGGSNSGGLDRGRIGEGATADPGTDLDADELENLATWATGRLRPDITVLLDRAPSPEGAPLRRTEPMAIGEDHVRVQRLLTRMAAAEPHRYVVVDADSSPEVVAERVREGLRPLMDELGRKAARRR
jgi:dTMP kinase